MGEAHASDSLGPNWLAETFDSVDIDIMARCDPGDALGGRLIDPVRDPITERQKHRLLMRFEARFQAWAGESIAAFKIRTGGSNAR